MSTVRSLWVPQIYGCDMGYSHIQTLLSIASLGDGERMHNLAMLGGNITQHLPSLLRHLERKFDVFNNPRPVNCFGLTFPNWVGLAAGVDKQGHAPLLWQALGFGFEVVGTVLQRPQQGNLKPRMFRDEYEQALINALGFNSDGVAKVVERLKKVRFDLRIPLFVSAGKMKNTPLESAADDYINVILAAWDVADGFILCVSSPNTPGLRELQKDRYLEHFVQTVVTKVQEFAKMINQTPKPILVKLAPDITDEEAAQMVEHCVHGGADGIILGNTTTRRDLLSNPSSPFAKQAGGLSGEPLFDFALDRLKFIMSLNPPLPLVFAGGVTSGARARQAGDAGAKLVKINTGFRFQGPGLVTNIRKAA